MTLLESNQSEARVIKVKLSKMIIFNMILAIILFLFILIRYYNINLLIAGIAYFGYLFFVFSKTTIRLNHDSLTSKSKNGAGKSKTLLYSNICKIEYKHVGLGDDFYFYEPQQKKYSMAISPQLFSPTDIRFVLNEIIEKNNDVQLDQRAQEFLKKC